MWFLSMDLFQLRSQMPKHKKDLDLYRYKRLAKWLDSLSDDELAFIDAFIEEIDFQLEEMVLSYSDYKESSLVIQNVKRNIK